MTAAEEQRRLAPVLERLDADGIPGLGGLVPTRDPATGHLRRVARLETTSTGSGTGTCTWSLAASQCRLIVMHAIQPAGVATRVASDPAAVWDGIRRFFDRRLTALREAGISGERLIIDPGLGYFLGDTPGPSLAALAGIRGAQGHLRRPRPGVTVTQVVPARAHRPGRQPVRTGDPGAEVFAAWQGADYIRTHDVAATRDALTVLAAIAREAATTARERSVRSGGPGA